MNEQDKGSGHVIDGFNPAELFGKGFNLGCVDLIQGGTLREVVGRSVAALLLHVTDQEGRRVFTKATIVLPPNTATKHTTESVLTALEKAINELRGSEVNEKEKSTLRRIITIINTSSLEVADLLRTLEQQGKRCLVAVVDASHYRDSSIDLPMEFGISAVRLEEDRWVPHVTSICQRLVTVVKALDGYGLVHVAEIPAQKRPNTEMLCSVDDCYVMNLRYDTDPEEVFSSRAQVWKSMVLQGRLIEAKAEIDELNLPDGPRLLVLAQLLQSAGQDSETLDVVTQLRPHLATLKAEVTIRVAQLAYQAGDAELARQLIPKCLITINDNFWLEAGLELSTNIEDNERIALFDARLAELLPDSGRLRENRDRRLLMNCYEAKPGKLHRFTTAGFAGHHMNLQEWLSAAEPDYSEIIEKASVWGSDWSDLAVVCCATHARSDGRPREAAVAASLITSSKLYGRQATQVLLWSIKSMMLKELVPVDESDFYRYLFQMAFRYLSHHPEDSQIRSNLTNLLSVESCGDMGVPLVALTMLDLAHHGVNLALPTPHPKANAAVKSDIAVSESMENGLNWLAEIGAGEPGVTVIPRELIVANPDDVVHTIGHLVHLTTDQRGENVDLEFTKKLVLLACTICPHATQERDEDIRLMRVLASQFAMEGQFQQARDFAEQILLMGHNSAYRCRLAWQAFGDVYHRCRNHVVALVSLACAMAIDVALAKADLWHEVYTIHRVLRDLGLFDISRSLLPIMKTLLSDLGFDEDDDPRYISAELNLKLMETKSTAPASIEKVLSEVVDACRNELGERSRLVPLAVLLAQTVLRAETLGVHISTEARTVLDAALEQIGTSMANMVRTVSTVNPSPNAVLAMFNDIEPAAYASDVARDQLVLGLATRRLLDINGVEECTLSEKTFAIELLADHTVALAGDAPSMTLDWPVSYAAELNQAGLDVAFLALDSQGELTVTCVSSGKIHLVEQPRAEQSFRRRFNAWLQDYPKDYGRIDRSNGNNLFFLTMEKLDVRLPSSQRLVVVAEPFLQQLAANLVVIQPEDGDFSYFAGEKIAIGVVPSLSWLSVAHTTKRSGRTAYKAWISAESVSAFQEVPELADEDTAEQTELKREPTLDIALSRLSGCFEQFGFIVDTGRRLPTDMNDAGLAVVTAHGGLNREGRYLHSIHDDDNLVEAPSALAHAFAGVELVILFVCSGGRIDKDPWTNSTTSLPKQLLNKGSRAVIASPWPLNVIVTYNWLEPFLREWDAGATVLDATKHANDAVAQHFGDVPQYSLAMRVYGDILLRKPGW